MSAGKQGRRVACPARVFHLIRREFVDSLNAGFIGSDARLTVTG
jgi:hypothetical protein